MRQRTAIGYPRLRRGARRAAASSCALTVLVLAALVSPQAAGAQVQPYGTNDYGGFRNVLPPGTNGLVNVVQLLQYETAGVRPPHNSDQLAMYSNLTTAAPNIQEAQIPQFFKDATFGVRSGNVASTESPEPGATIVRDSQFGVPHIYGDTRPELMFAIGYATAEDRLFFIDALRHAGQGDLAQFAGGANVSMDESVWASEPYTQQDLANQVNYGIAHSADGPQVLQDATNYVTGINAYIARAQNPLFTATTMPAEYTVLGLTPKPFTVEDLVSIATLVGGIFGNGGGAQLSNAVLYENLLSPLRSRAPGGSGFARGGARSAGERHGASGAPRSCSHAQASQGSPGHGSRSFRLRDLPEPRRPERSRGAHDGSWQLVPVPDPAAAEHDGPREPGAP